MKANRWTTLAILATAVAIGAAALAQEKKAAKAPSTKAAAKKPVGPPPVPPTLANVAYGDHPKQVLDFYKAESKTPTPVLFYIHGGGWMNGSKNGIANLKEYLAAGISVVSVEYRFVSEAAAANIKPPVQWPLHDAARALQFVRAHAAEWNLDKQRIGASGGSAGACSSLWLAFHDDMADPKSKDPIARESTRLWCAGVSGAQTTLDPKQMKEWTPNSRYGGHAFGCNGDKDKKLSGFDHFLAERDRIMPWIKEYSPYELVSKDDPPIAMSYGGPPALGKDEKDPTHTCNFGIKLQEKLKSVGVECQLIYPGTPDTKYKNCTEFLIDKLKAGK